MILIFYLESNESKSQENENNSIECRISSCYFRDFLYSFIRYVNGNCCSRKKKIIAEKIETERERRRKLENTKKYWPWKDWPKYSWAIDGIKFKLYVITVHLKLTIHFYFGTNHKYVKLNKNSKYCIWLKVFMCITCIKRTKNIHSAIEIEKRFISQVSFGLQHGNWYRVSICFDIWSKWYLILPPFLAWLWCHLLLVFNAPSSMDWKEEEKKYEENVVPFNAIQSLTWVYVCIELYTYSKKNSLALSSESAIF